MVGVRNSGNDSTVESMQQSKPNEMSPLENKDGDQSTYFTEKISIPETDEEVGHK